MMPPRSNEARFSEPDDDADEIAEDRHDLRRQMLAGRHILTIGLPLDERRRITDDWITRFKAADDHLAE